MKVEKGKRVRIEYELKIEGGDVIESSAQRGPLEFVHGDGKMLPGFEKRMEGMSKGEERDGVIPAAEAFGTEDSLPTMQLARAHFPSSEPLELGKAFEAKDAGGNPVRFKVIKIEGNEVTVRLDHPLAGKAIRFKVKVLEISELN
jgi:FKBP-type peptidyl-prolyl cis-trans isomerase 2